MSECTPPNPERVLAIFTFSPGAKGVMGRLRRNFLGILAGTPAGDGLEILSAYKRNTNLRDLLVHSRLPKMGGRLRGVREPRTLKIWGKQEAFHLPRINLTTKNCVYVIQCAKCGKQYVGQTMRTIRKRLYQHRSQIRAGSVGNETRSVIEHFGRHGVKSVRIQGLEHNYRWMTKQRLYKEHVWIGRLYTGAPNGLNDQVPGKRTC